MKRLVIFSIVSILGLGSCVSGRIHEELQAKYKVIEDENVELKSANDSLGAGLLLANNDLDRLNKEIDGLIGDTTRIGRRARVLFDQYAELNKSYEFLLENNNSLLASNQKENQKLTNRLNKLQAELEAKEDSLNKEQKRMEYLAGQLQSREARVGELESQIARKDSAVQVLKKRIADALLNFDGKGLTVTNKNGKVYVSLENSLLFSSGSWKIDSRGKEALVQLAIVLAENPDLNVVVEGHTDNDEFNGRTAVKDNWDLSVMRATSIVKILLSNEKVNPQKVTAAGRSEYVPIATNETPEGKATNRRTEIIITPNLSELVDFLEGSDK